MSGNSEFFTRETEFFLSGRLDTDAGYVYSERVCDIFSHLVDIGSKLGSLGDNGRVYV